MSDELKGIWTAKGLEKLAAAYAGGAPLVLRQIAVGDGGGSVPAPAPSWTGLAAEKWRGNVNAVMVNPDAPTEVVADVVLPFNVGGFFIREWGLFDEAGDMVAVGPHAETYKPLIAEGTAVEVTERIRLPLTNTSAVTLAIASAAMATQQYVRQYVTQVVEGHDADGDAHAGRLDALAEALATHGHAYATEETPGFVRRATDEEVEARTGNGYVSPSQLGEALESVDVAAAMRDMLAGDIVMWGNEVIPVLADGLPKGLELNGDVVSLETFPRLLRKWCGATANATAEAFYRCTDAGVREVAGNHMRLLDMRGVAPRGWDHGRGMDADRVLGSFQADEFASHVHTQSRNSASGSLGNKGCQGTDTNNNGYSSGSNGTGATGGTETRMKNAAVMFIIYV
ncbi:phage tail protein [Nitratidesulfovibrio termitidis]|uniref:phage tail protein n=1 Tax=Nitratidesulfovibrio termitidis TaxID=42252 RepID=UPI0003FB816E|nr:phage tail protein [Nitratidesulfovibrio termitidis]